MKSRKILIGEIGRDKRNDITGEVVSVTKHTVTILCDGKHRRLKKEYYGRRLKIKKEAKTEAKPSVQKDIAARVLANDQTISQADWIKWSRDTEGSRPR